MTKPKPTHRSFGPGGWVDESVPDLSKLLGPFGVDLEEFRTWLAPRLGKLRSDAEIKVQMPTPEAEREAVRDFLAHIRGVLQGIIPKRLPPIASSRMLYVAHQAGIHWYDMTEHLQTDLLHLEYVGSRVLAELEGVRGKAGRPSAAARDRLLADTAAKLLDACGKAEVAGSVAHDVLHECGISFPTKKGAKASDKTSTIKKATRRGNKSR